MSDEAFWPFVSARTFVLDAAHIFEHKLKNDETHVCFSHAPCKVGKFLVSDMHFNVIFGGTNCMCEDKC